MEPLGVIVAFGPSTLMSLTGSGPHLSQELRVPPSEEDYSYLANFSGKALEEEFVNLVRYPRQASATLALGGAGCWDALWFD